MIIVWEIGEMKAVLDENLISLKFDLRRNVSPVLKWLDSGDTAENFFEGQISTARKTEQKISLEVKSQRD
jgi:hypothetical protein